MSLEKSLSQHFLSILQCVDARNDYTGLVIVFFVESLISPVQRLLGLPCALSLRIDVDKFSALIKWPKYLLRTTKYLRTTPNLHQEKIYRNLLCIFLVVFILVYIATHPHVYIQA